MARAADVANAVGRLLVGVGLLVLAFAVFQLWGTGLAEAQAQDDLEGQFEAMLAGLDQAEAVPDDPGTGLTPDVTSEIGAVNETTHVPFVRQVTAEQLPALGEAAGRLYIPALGVEKSLVHGVSRDDLRLGPGHYPATPWPGQEGNAAIAGHRTTHGAPFLNLDRLRPGDDIFVHSIQGVFHYKVQPHEDQWGHDQGHFIVQPHEVDVLDDFGDNRLTLTACHPRYSAAQRLIVTAELVSEPAPTLAVPDPGFPTELASERADDIGRRASEPTASDPTASDPIAGEPIAGDATADTAAAMAQVAGNQPGRDATANTTSQSALPDEALGTERPMTVAESLGWQPQHWPSTALWGLLTSVVSLLATLAGRRWTRWPVYLAAAGPVLYCLYRTFTYLDKMLPAV